MVKAIFLFIVLAVILAIIKYLYKKNDLLLLFKSKRWVAIIILSFLIVGCNEPAAKKSGYTLNDVFQLPSPKPLPAAQSDFYKSVCQNWFNQSLVSTGFNGGMLVAKDGNIVFEAYNGVVKLGSKELVNRATSFHIASVSKTFTAMAVLKLWQDHKLQLDDFFSKYFPAFNYPGVTIRTLLNHRSGLPNYVYFMEELGWHQQKYVTNRDVLDCLISQKEVLKNIGKPDASFTYCNTNYALLALLIEKLSGVSYSNYLTDNFFKPLQMEHTFVFDTTMIGKALPSYDWRGVEIPFNYLDAVYGDKNIYSTPYDLLLWDRLLNTNLVFAARTLEEAYRPYSHEHAGIRNYGLGWRMFDFPGGRKIVYHNGWWHGNNAVLLRPFQDGATIILLGNKYNRNIYHARDLIGLFGHYGTVESDE